MASVGGSDEGVSLNIMPMLDIFSILILFLLMNFSTDPVSHDLDEGVTLPFSATIASLDEIPTVRLSKTSLMVNDHQVTALLDGLVPGKVVTQGAIIPLHEELVKLRAANEAIAKEKNKPGTLTVEIDKEKKFLTIKKVLLSAQQADFVEFKLMVEKQL